MVRERTVITTMEITMVYKDVAQSFGLVREEIANIQKQLVKAELNADDVVITNVQEFVL